MSHTTYAIGAALSGRYPEAKIVHESNYAVDGDEAITDKIVGVMVRYERVNDTVRWCYV